MSLRSPFYDIPTSRDVQIAHTTHAADAGSLSPCSFQSPCRALLTGVDWIPLAAVTGTDTDTVNINIINRGTDGTGTDELADVNFVAGTNAADLTALSIYSPAANAELQMTQGTVISCNFEQVENGLALPAGTFVFTFEPN